MKTFTDTANHEWTVSVNVAALKRVRDLCGVDLMELPSFDQDDPTGSLLHRLGSDPVLLVDVLYAVIKPQADERGVSDEQFAEALGGDALADATDALISECVGFFRGGVRDALTKVMEKAKKADAILMEQLAKAVADPALDAAIDEAVRQAGSASGDAPASSESTPAP
jgi:hypothetical protein